MVSPEISRLEQKLTREVLWIYILSILCRSDMHAYALRQEILGKFGFLPGHVSAYVVLYKLEARGFVSSKTVSNRRVYSVTPAGKKLFRQANAFFKEVSRMVFS